MELRWYQHEAVEAAYSYLMNEAGNPLVCLPTGSGKSLVIAELCRRAVKEFKGRVIVCQHRKELAEQNGEKIAKLVDCSLGYYSAGLRRFATDTEIVCGGIQSIYSKAALFGSRQLLIVDECHLIADEGMYKNFIDDLREINPRLRVIGLTATPFRTGEGALCRANGTFQKICYNAPIRQLIEEGFLCLVKNPPMSANVDTSSLHIRGGEFIAREMESLFSFHDGATCKEIIAKTQGRHSILVFCSSVMHAHHVAKIIEDMTGERVGIISGETLDLERSANISDFRTQRLRWLVNCDVLTTGFDAPCIDAIAILRATNSPGLYAQIVGRGLRKDPSKQDCIVLDFGENIKRHGPIDAIDFGKPKSQGGNGGEMPEKVCPSCEEPNKISTKVCQCGFEFPRKEPQQSLDAKADEESKILSEPEVFDVQECVIGLHLKKKVENPIPTLRVDYRCTQGEGNIETIISEWVCLEHSGFARNKAVAWWKARSIAPVPSTIEEATELADAGAIAIPRQITAQRDGRFWRVLLCVIEEIPQEWGVVQEELPF